MKGAEANRGAEMSELLNLRQTGSVAAFCDSFETLFRKVPISEAFAVSFFLQGLKPTIQENVKLFMPQTLAHAYAIAKLQEATLASLTKKKTTTKKPPTSTDFDERRAKGLCLWCDETYGKGHQCKKKWQQLYVLEVEDDIEEPKSFVVSNEIDRTEIVVEAEMLDQMPDRIETVTIASMEEVYGLVAAVEVFEAMPVLEITQAVEFEPIYEATQFKDNLLQSQERFLDVIVNDYLLIAKDLFINCKHLNLPYHFDSHGVTNSAINFVFLSSIIAKLLGMNRKLMAFPFMLEVFDKNHERKPNDYILLGNSLRYECWQTDAFVQSKLFDPGTFLIPCYMHLKKFGSLTIKTTEEADECDFTKKDPSGRYVRSDEIPAKGVFKTVYKGIVEADGVHIFCTSGMSLRVISCGTQAGIYVSMNDKLGGKLNANSFDVSMIFDPGISKLLFKANRLMDNRLSVYFVLNDADVYMKNTIEFILNEAGKEEILLLGTYLSDSTVRYNGVRSPNDLLELVNEYFGDLVGNYVARVTLHVKPFDPGITRNSFEAYRLIEADVIKVCAILQGGRGQCRKMLLGNSSMIAAEISIFSALRSRLFLRGR